MLRQVILGFESQTPSSVTRIFSAIRFEVGITVHKLKCVPTCTSNPFKGNYIGHSWLLVGQHDYIVYATTKAIRA